MVNDTMSGSLTSQWSRAIDRRAIEQYGMSGLVLMENAGRGCADLLERLGIDGSIAIVCGKGNNAGDGFVLARHLELRGHSVQVLLGCNPAELRGDAAVNFAILRQAETPIVGPPQRLDAVWLQQQLNGATWIVDAILGTGTQGAPRPPWNVLIELLNQFSARKLAVDLPSGLNCDTGEPSQPTFRADHTATFVAPKSGFCAPQAQTFLGTVHVLDIGVPKKLVKEILTASAGLSG
jgi:NAD(P)H-hydrate epimerase